MPCVSKKYPCIVLICACHSPNCNGNFWPLLRDSPDVNCCCHPFQSAGVGACTCGHLYGDMFSIFFPSQSCGSFLVPSPLHILDTNITCKYILQWLSAASLAPLAPSQRKICMISLSPCLGCLNLLISIITEILSRWHWYQQRDSQVSVRHGRTTSSIFNSCPFRLASIHSVLHWLSAVDH